MSFKYTPHKYCNNCGREGHIYRNCKFPVLSYGIVCFTSESKLLIIRRKDSLSFIEFMRGKYSLENRKYISELLNGCSIIERELLKTLTFDELWKHVWYQGGELKQTDRMIKEYNHSKTMFETLTSSNILSMLLTSCSTKYLTPEWEFPKGRRYNKEKNMVCAIREFEEETNLSKEEYILFRNVEPISEEYIGSNGVRYKHVYYYALYNGTKELSINPDKFEQASEIGDIQWLTIDECRDIFRSEQSTKHTIIETISTFMDTWREGILLKE